MIKITEKIRKDVKEAATSVARDLLTGALVPGIGRSFEHGGAPRCSIGHILARAGIKDEHARVRYAEFLREVVDPDPGSDAAHTALKTIERIYTRNDICRFDQTARAIRDYALLIET